MENEKPGGNHQSFKDEKNALNSYAKYTGVAFQMMAIIGFFAFIGYQADKYFQHQTQWITALSSVVGVCFSIYNTIRQLKSWL